MSVGINSQVLLELPQAYPSIIEVVYFDSKADVGCVGAKLYYSNNRVQHGDVIIGLKGMAGHAHRFLPREADDYCDRLK